MGAGAGDGRGVGTWRAARAFGGPAAKMASRGLGAQPPPPPGRLREGAEAEAPISPPVSAPPVQSPPLIALPLGEWRGWAKGSAEARCPPASSATPPVRQSSPGAAAPRAQITCRFLGYFSFGSSCPSARILQTNCGCHYIHWVPLVFFPPGRDVNIPTTCEFVVCRLEKMCEVSSTDK